MEQKKQLEEAKKAINTLYSLMADTARDNEILYVMPVSVYNVIMDKIQRLDSKLQRQTKSLMMHIKDKEEMAREIKELRRVTE